MLLPWHLKDSRDCLPFPMASMSQGRGWGHWGKHELRSVPGGQAVPTLPLGDLAVAMRGERRVPLLVEGVGVLLWARIRPSRCLPIFLGVLRILNAIDWRL